MPHVELIPVGALLVDLNTKLTSASAKMLREAKDAYDRSLGIRGVIRTLSIEDPQPNDLDSEEVKAILGEGLSLCAYQHPRFEGWMPVQHSGATDGRHAGLNAMKAGCLPGMTLACDLEGVGVGSTISDVCTWGNGWWSSGVTVGYQPCLYVGAECLLDAHQLYHALSFELYWSSLSEVPTPERRGFAMWQIYGGQASSSGNVGGIPVDYNIVGRDRLGSGPHWMSP